MLACTCCLILGGSAYSKAVEAQRENAIKELIGDATLITGTGEAQGFSGSVTASVTYANNIIVELSVAAADDTPEIGGVAATQLVNTILEKHSIDGVDVVAGATYTSNGVLDAIRAAMGIEVYKPTDEELFAAAAEELLPGSTLMDVELVEDALGVYSDGKSYAILAQGVGHYPENPFKVVVVLDGTGAVQGFKVIYSHETDGFGTEVLKEEYWNQYYGATLITRKSNGEGTHIDTVSGATETSVGLYNLVKVAFAQYAAIK